MQPLSVQAVSPEIHSSENKRLITPSQGLLATTHSSHAAHTAPVLPPSNISRQIDPAPQVLGLKLLQLHCPPSPQQSGPQHPQSPQTLPTANPATIESHHDNLRYNDRSSSVPKRQPSFYPPHDPTPRHSQPQSLTSERSRVQGFSLLPPALPAHTPEPMQGLRLLHLQPVPHSNTTFPKLPLPPSSRFTPNIAVPMGEAPMIKLLHIDAGPQMASSTSVISRFFWGGFMKYCIVVYVQIFVSATDVSQSSSFSPNAPPHVRGGIVQFSGREGER